MRWRLGFIAGRPDGRRGQRWETAMDERDAYRAAPAAVPPPNAEDGLPPLAPPPPVGTELPNAPGDRAGKPAELVAAGTAGWLLARCAGRTGTARVAGRAATVAVGRTGTAAVGSPRRPRGPAGRGPRMAAPRTAGTGARTQQRPA